MSWIAVGIAGATTAANMIGQAQREKSQKQLAGKTAEFSPWTGMKPAPIQYANPGGALASGAAMGVGLHQGMAKSPGAPDGVPQIDGASDEVPQLNGAQQAMVIDNSGAALPGQPATWAGQDMNDPWQKLQMQQMNQNPTMRG